MVQRVKPKIGRWKGKELYLYMSIFILMCHVGFYMVFLLFHFSLVYSILFYNEQNYYVTSNLVKYFHN